MTIIVRSGREWMRALVSSKERPVTSIISNSGFNSRIDFTISALVRLSRCEAPPSRTTRRVSGSICKAERTVSLLSKARTTRVERGYRSGIAPSVLRRSIPAGEELPGQNRSRRAIARLGRRESHRHDGVELPSAVLVGDPIGNLRRKVLRFRRNGSDILGHNVYAARETKLSKSLFYPIQKDCATGPGCLKRQQEQDSFGRSRLEPRYCEAQAEPSAASSRRTSADFDRAAHCLQVDSGA